MRVRISDMGGSDARLCRVDIEDAVAGGQYTMRIFAIHARGVFDQNYTFNGANFSTPPFSLPTKDLSGRITTSISVEAFVSRISGGLAVESNRFEMSYFLQAVEMRVEVPAPLPPGAIVPQRRVGTYTIRDFTVLNAIYQAGAPKYFIKKDLDFINIQLLSIRQAVQKMEEVALARAQDPNITAIYRTRADKRKEYSARIDAGFVEYLQETTRIMRYAVDEVRYNQKFNLLSPTLVRDLELLP
jgi:hypothetical protein